MAITLYGIPNCDQVKNARSWLDAHSLPYLFHDFKKAGIPPVVIEGWLRHVDWNVLLNRKGTTWRTLPDERKSGVLDARSAIALMMEYPSVIKRPVLATGVAVHVGFSVDTYQQIFLK